MIRVLIVDDSVTAQRFLTLALSGQPDFEVVGSAATGLEAVQLAERLRPTLITMDIRMPDMDGLKATEEIMAASPTRIVIVSGEVGSPDQKVTFDALQAGALEVLPKAQLGGDGESFERYRSQLLSTLRAMASVSVLRRRRGGSGLYLRPAPPPEQPTVLPSPRSSLPPLQRSGPLRPPEQSGARVRRLGRRYRFLAIGASTGGPQVLAQLVSDLPASLALPVAIVQHMSPGFTLGFTRWLAGEARLPVKQAEDGEPPQAGKVYVAPDGWHLRLTREGRFSLSQEPQESAFRPSVDVLFSSVAAALGPSAIGLLLTGMGQDGAQGMLDLRRAGSWTLAQEAETCVVNGMPQAAADLGGVDAFVSPSMIPALLVEASELR